MTKLMITMAARLVALLMLLALPATSSAAGSARWTTYPACTGTATALTCTGKAAGVQPRFYPGLSPVEAAIRGEVHYTCTDPVFQSIFYGYPTFGPTVAYLASTGFHNGKTFSIEFLPPPGPPGMLANATCLSGQWTRDPNYYNVRVAVGWGFGSATPIEALEAPLGTVSPE